MTRCRCVGAEHSCGIQTVIVQPPVTPRQSPEIVYVGQGGPRGFQGIQGIQGLQGFTGAQGTQGIQGLQGLQGQAIQGATGTAVTILGSYPDYASLVAAHPTGTPGDGYLVNGDLYVWASDAWVNVGNISGPQGVQGFTGAQGTTGTQGATGTMLASTDDLVEGDTNLYFTTSRVAYVHTQGAVSTTWTITHNLGFYPNVTVQDSAGNIVEGEISYLTSASLIATFQAGFSGKAYLS